MAAPVTVNDQDWVQVAPVAFESGIFKPSSGSFYLEFAPTKPAATARRLGVYVAPGQPNENYSFSAKPTDAAWARSARAGTSRVEVIT